MPLVNIFKKLHVLITTFIKLYYFAFIEYYEFKVDNCQKSIEIMRDLNIFNTPHCCELRNLIYCLLK